jgi:hypothetical protein
MITRSIPIDELEVTIYYIPNCPIHVKTGDLRDVLVEDCPYYLCLKNNDRVEFDRYAEAVRKKAGDRQPSITGTYEDLIQRKGAMVTGQWKPKPLTGHENDMKVFKDSNLLEEGHRRAAILRYLWRGTPKRTVDVVVNEASRRPQHQECHCH